MLSEVAGEGMRVGLRKPTSVIGNGIALNIIKFVLKINQKPSREYSKKAASHSKCRITDSFFERLFKAAGAELSIIRINRTIN